MNLFQRIATPFRMLWYDLLDSLPVSRGRHQEVSDEADSLRISTGFYKAASDNLQARLDDRGDIIIALESQIAQLKRAAQIQAEETTTLTMHFQRYLQRAEDAANSLRWRPINGPIKYEGNTVTISRGVGKTEESDKT